MLGQLELPLGRRAVETSANLISSSQAFQIDSMDADSLHRISVPFQGRCPQPAASVLPLSLAGAADNQGRSWFCFLSHQQVCKESQESCPDRERCLSCPLLLGLFSMGQQYPAAGHPSTCHHSPPLGLGQQGPLHLSLPFSQTLNSFAKILTPAYSVALTDVPSHHDVLTQQSTLSRALTRACRRKRRETTMGLVVCPSLDTYSLQETGASSR